MRKLGRTSTDSLELLLDTVCSMFGAIILIAILVALLAQSAKVVQPVAKAGTEILERKIATAEADLVQARQLKEQLGKPANEAVAALFAEKQQLEQAIQAAQARNKDLGGQIQTEVTRQGMDFTDESKKLSAALLVIQRKQMELVNSIKAQKENSNRLQDRFAALDQQMQKTKEAHVEKLRLPKERSRTKEAFNVILKYNRVYPLLSANLEQNLDSLEWEQALFGDAQIPTPLRGKGLDVVKNRAEIARLIHDLHDSGTYFTFYVYTDSFETFRTLKELVVQDGADLGWQPVLQNVKLKFGKNGHSPPPL